MSRNNNSYGDDEDSLIGRPLKQEKKSSSEQKKDRQADGDPSARSTESGQEGARGIHGANEGGTDELPGSEPLKQRSDEHVSGYGGDKGKPKRSSDQR